MMRMDQRLGVGKFGWAIGHGARSVGANGRSPVQDPRHGRSPLRVGDLDFCQKIFPRYARGEERKSRGESPFARKGKEGKRKKG